MNDFSTNLEFLKKIFLEHQNWFGMDDTLGPVAISLKREKVEMDTTVNGCSSSPSVLFRYRIIIRTSEVNILVLYIQ